MVILILHSSSTRSHPKSDAPPTSDPPPPLLPHPPSYSIVIASNSLIRANIYNCIDLFVCVCPPNKHKQTKQSNKKYIPPAIPALLQSVLISNVTDFPGNTMRRGTPSDCHTDSNASTGNQMPQPNTQLTHVSFGEDDSSCDSHTRWGKPKRLNFWRYDNEKNRIKKTPPYPIFKKEREWKKKRKKNERHTDHRSPNDVELDFVTLVLFFFLIFRFKHSDLTDVCYFRWKRIFFVYLLIGFIRCDRLINRLSSIIDQRITPFHFDPPTFVLLHFSLLSLCFGITTSKNHTVWIHFRTIFFKFFVVCNQSTIKSILINLVLRRQPLLKWMIWS